MKNNIDIFIGSVKDPIKEFKPPFKLMMLGGVKSKHKTAFNDDTDDNISYINKSLCEFTGMYWVWKNFPLKDYIGFCQYRRVFTLDLFNEQNIEGILNKREIIIANSIQLSINVASQYALMHNINDLILLSECIKEKYPNYYDTFIKFINGNQMFSNNCFIMKQNVFKNYCTFVWDIISLFMKKTNIRTYEDCMIRVNNDKKNYLKNIPSCPQNGTVEYQSRFLAYLAERLTTLFIMHNFKNPAITRTVMTEKKYNIE